MVRRAFGDFVVMRSGRLTPSGWAIIVLSASALVLGGCGRKAGLDAPPNALNSSSAVAPDPEADRAATPSVSDGGPVAARGRKKPFFLDPLLD